MTLSEGINLKGTPAYIPGHTRDDFPQFFVERGYKVGAEIGVLSGEFSEKICKAGLRLYSIDPWVGFKGQGVGQKSHDKQEEIYQFAKNRLAPYDCTIIRKTSMDALQDVREQLDFVYIDGDHNFKHVAEDIYEWSRKVRSGGIVSGHDYWHTGPNAHNIVCQVDAVVDAYTKLFGIENWWIIDRTKSWFFIKP